MKRVGSLLMVLTFLCDPAFGQNLNALRARSQDFWNAIVGNESFRAMEYVEFDGRAEFFEQRPQNVVGAEVIGMEFTGSPDEVSVTIQTTFLHAMLGRLERKRSDLWVWDGSDWYMRPPGEGLASPFGVTGVESGEPEGTAVPFEFLLAELDLGDHVQGDQIEGSLPFRAGRGTIRSVRPSALLGSIPGLRFERPEWIDEETARLPYVWDTTLVASAQDEVVAMSIRDNGRDRELIPLRIFGRIEPRIRFTQVPDVVDMAEAGTFELVIENVAYEPFEIRRSSSPNSNYEIESEWPEVFEPGSSGKIVVRYPATDDPERASLTLTFVEPVLGLKRLSWKINLAESPDGEGAGYTSEELEEILRSLPARPPGVPPPRRADRHEPYL